MIIKIEKIIYPGKSLGFSENKTILTNEGIPGEIVEVIPLEEKKNYISKKLQALNLAVKVQRISARFFNPTFQ